MPATKLSLASFNLLNLNLPGRRMYRDPDGWSQDEYDRKVLWTASVLKTLRPRVWGFQELWHEDALEEVFTAAGIIDDYDLLTPPGHSGNSIVCAGAVEKGLLTGTPEWIRVFPDKFILDSGGDDAQTPDISVSIDSFSRPTLKFTIKPRSNGSNISVYVAHLKSKQPTAIYREGWYRNDTDFYRKHSEGLGYAISTIRRTAEAAALRMLIVEELKDTKNPLVVLGDLNNDQHSDTLNILTGQPNYLIGGSTGGGDVDLYSVNTLQEYRSLRDVFYTHIYQNVMETLDHVLVSEEFYDNSTDRIWAYDGMEIYNDHLNTDDHKTDGTADHGIVKANFTYDPF